MTTDEKISIRGYAKRIGVSETAIRKAIKTGKIKAGYDFENKKIIPALANKEYGSLVDNNLSVSDNPAIKDNADKKISLSRDMPFAEIRKAKELVQTKLLALELQKEEGKLVSKELVYKELFEFGKKIKTALLQIPDRNIDDIINAGNRHEAFSILYKAITDVLLQLSDTATLKL